MRRDSMLGSMIISFCELLGQYIRQEFKLAKREITEQEAIDKIVHSFPCHTGGQYCGIVDRFKNFIKEQRARVDYENNGKFETTGGHPPTLKGSPFFGKYICDFYMEGFHEHLSVRIDDPNLPQAMRKLIASAAIVEWIEHAGMLGMETPGGINAAKNALAWRKWFEGELPKGTEWKLPIEAVRPAPENVALATFQPPMALPDLPGGGSVEELPENPAPDEEKPLGPDSMGRMPGDPFYDY